MKILYITPKINNEGGVAKVLSVKTNYLIEKWGYQIAICTQNSDNSKLFFDFNSKIKLFDIKLNSNKIKFYFDYKRRIKNIINDFNPDVIIVSDNGLKGFLFPLLVKTSVPILFEVHGSKFNEEKEYSKNFLTKLFLSAKYKIRNFGAKQFDYFVALSNESASEWKIKNTKIIPNPIQISDHSQAFLNSKKAIVVSRNSYEKGLDRLSPIWKKVIETNKDWILEIYGVDTKDEKLVGLISKLELSSNVVLSNPVKNIQDKYSQASMYLMTSRNEGFPMVLLEAMSNGLPCIAYDCPIGPRAIITNNENGFLIEDGNQNLFAEKINLLIANEDVRKKLGNNAKLSTSKYTIDIVINKWNVLLQSIKTTI